MAAGQNIVQLEQRTRQRQWINLEDIQPRRCKVTAPEGGFQRDFIHQRAARAVLMKSSRASSSPSVRALMTFRFSGVTGRCRDTKSDCASTSSNDAKVTPPLIGEFNRRIRIISDDLHSHADARVATARPMRPRPTIPSVCPMIRGVENRVQVPSRTTASRFGNPRPQPKSRAMVCSATAW